MRCSPAVQAVDALLLDRRLSGLGRSVVTSHRLWLAGALFGVLTLNAPARVTALPTPIDAQAAPAAVAATIDVIRLAQAAQPTPTPGAPAANPPAAAPPTNPPAATTDS